MSNDPDFDDSYGEFLESSMLYLIEQAKEGKRVEDAEHYLWCEPEDDDEWDALPCTLVPDSSKRREPQYWDWLWRTDRAAYARWMSHQLSVSTDEQLESILGLKDRTWREE